MRTFTTSNSRVGRRYARRMPDACPKCGEVNYPLYWLDEGKSIKAIYRCCGMPRSCWWDKGYVEAGGVFR